MSCKHGNWAPCEECDADDALYMQISALQSENARLRAALHSAADYVESWGAYADDYFKCKHDLAGDVKRIRAAAEAGK